MDMSLGKLGVGDGQGGLVGCSSWGHTESDTTERLNWTESLSHAPLFAIHELQPTRLRCPWDFPGKDTGVVYHSLLQGIFLTQGSNLGLLHCRQILSQLSYQGSPIFSKTNLISSLFWSFFNFDCVIPFFCFKITQECAFIWGHGVGYDWAT